MYSFQDIEFWRNYWFNMLLISSHWINTLTAGDPSEPFSSRVGKWQQQGLKRGVFLAKIIDGIFGKDHCKRNIETDEGKNSAFDRAALGF